MTESSPSELYKYYTTRYLEDCVVFFLNIVGVRTKRQIFHFLIKDIRNMQTHQRYCALIDCLDLRNRDSGSAFSSDLYYAMQ